MNRQAATENLPITIGTLIKNARVRKNLSQPELSRQAEVSARWLSSAENGKLAPNPRPGPIIRVARTLGEDPEAFLRMAGITTENTELLAEKARPASLSLTRYWDRIIEQVAREPESVAEFRELVRLFEGNTAWKRVLIDMVYQLNELVESKRDDTTLLEELRENAILLTLSATRERLRPLVGEQPETFNDEIGDELWQKIFSAANSTIWTTNCTVDAQATGSSALECFLAPQHEAIKRGVTITRIFALTEQSLERPNGLESIVNQQRSIGVDVWLTTMRELELVASQQIRRLPSHDIMIIDQRVVHFSILVGDFRLKRSFSDKTSDLQIASNIQRRLHDDGKAIQVKSSTDFSPAIISLRS